MSFQQSVNTALASHLGAKGISDAAYKSALELSAVALQRLRNQAKNRTLPLLYLPYEKEDLAEIYALVPEIKKGAKNIYVLGTGGSSLGGQTLAQLKNYMVPGFSSLPPAKPAVHFLDNLDPLSMESLLENLDPKTSKVIAVSKSGGTGETLLQTICFLNLYIQAGLSDKIGMHFYGLSEPEGTKKNPLRQLLAPYGVTFLNHHTGVGGRYSVLSNTGLLPAALLGLDIQKIRDGAAAALRNTLDAEKPADALVAQGAALQFSSAEAGKNISIMMPYTDRLALFTKWYVQLWAESLGKEGKGTQPVPALGPVDQHSQQQLYLAGPADKLFTVITVKTFGQGRKMPTALAEAALQPDFANRSIGDFVHAQTAAMLETFKRNGCPVRHISLENLDEFSLGQLLMHFMLETIVTGHMMYIDPFDQPAVEEAKILAKAFLAQS